MSVSGGKELPVKIADFGITAPRNSVGEGLFKPFSHAIESRFRIAPFFVDRRVSRPLSLPRECFESTSTPFVGSQFLHFPLAAFGGIRTPQASKKLMTALQQDRA
jgi:hypothetical protein